MKRFIALIAAMFIITASLPSLSAQVYRFDFSGTIAESSFLTEFSVGTEFSGYILLDFGLLENPTFLEGPSSRIGKTIIGGDLVISGHEYDFASANEGFYLSVRFNPNDADVLFDGHRDIGDTHLSLRGAETPFSYEEGGVVPEHLLLGSFISGETLMVSAVQQETFDEFTASGLVTSVMATAIPEPSSVVLVTGALALCIVSTTRRKRR